MDENELTDGIAALLKEAGFADVEKRTSSRSVTLSAQRADRSVLVHVAGPEPAAGPRSSVNPELLRREDVRVKASMPGGLAAVASGSGGPPVTKHRPVAER